MIVTERKKLDTLYDNSMVFQIKKTNGTLLRIHINAIEWTQNSGNGLPLVGEGRWEDGICK